jgi:electron transport complex protein RnfE
MTDTRSHHLDDLLLLTALCPLLAASDTLVGALSVGIAALVTFACTTALLALLGRWLERDTRAIGTLLLAACVVALIELTARAWLHPAYQATGVFLPLVVANLAFVHLTYDATSPARVLRLMLAAAAALVILGIAREIVGRGSLLHGAQLLLGAPADEITLFRVDMGFLLAMLPPGAFIALGLLLALRNWLNERRSAAE